MKLLVHTSTPSHDIPQQLGRPEYSYRFVVREFKPLLDQFGTVIEIADPAQEVDAIYDACTLTGEPCVFLSFLPPNKVPLGLRCPTVPVFAWEFERLPDEAFIGKPRNDWRRMLNRLGGAITHSSYTVAKTQDALGKHFPIVSIPAPLWDRMQTLSSRPPSRSLHVDGLVIDSTRVDLSAFRKSNILAALPDALPLPTDCYQHDGQIELDGVVYTAILNPHDARKNWMQMINTFCEALRDKADATLLIKLTHHDPSAVIPNMLEAIYTMGPIACRVVLVHAYLDTDAYETLLRTSAYAVNVSNGEGQCLPLMEYMSAGVPAVASRHTSMCDYLDTDCAFVVDSSVELGAWPHDQRQAYRTLRQRVHYQSLLDAYRRSYYVATREPDVYGAMSMAATESLRRYCSMAVLRPRLEQFLSSRLSRPDLQSSNGTG